MAVPTIAVVHMIGGGQDNDESSPYRRGIRCVRREGVPVVSVHPGRPFRGSVPATATVVLAMAGLLITGCRAGAAEGPGPHTPTSTDVLVEPLAQTTVSQSPCQWVQVTSTQGHALPAELASMAGRVELRSCGAPEGDTSGLGGPVEWRVVTTS